LKWRRKDPCNICGKPYVIDDQKREGRCACGKVKGLAVPSKELLKLAFDPVPGKTHQIRQVRLRSKLRMALPEAADWRG
jgi:hypothetical protein